MTALSKNPTSNSVVVTGWTAPTYIYNEDGTQLATAAPGKAAYITSDFGGFDFSGLPDGATINSLTVLCQAKASTGALTVLHLLWQPWSGGAAIGSEYDIIQLTTSLAPYSQTWTLTAAQIKAADFKIRLRGYRTGNTGYTLSVDYIRVTVDYSLALAIQDASQAQVVDQLTLTAHVPHFSLVIQDAGQTQPVDSLTLTAHAPSTPLAVQDAAQLQAADHLALTQHGALTINAATQAHNVDSPALTQHNHLLVADAGQLQSADNPSLTYHAPAGVLLTIQNAAHTQSPDTPALAQHHQLIIAGATQAQSADQPSLTQHNTLAIVGAAQGQTAEQAALTAHAPGGVTLFIQDGVLAQAAQAPALTQHHLLVIQDAGQAQAGDDLNLIQHAILIIAICLQLQAADTVLFSIPLNPSDEPGQRTIYSAARRRTYPSRRRIVLKARANGD